MAQLLGFPKAGGAVSSGGQSSGQNELLGNLSRYQGGAVGWRKPRAQQGLLAGLPPGLLPPVSGVPDCRGRDINDDNKEPPFLDCLLLASPCEVCC